VRSIAAVGVAVAALLGAACGSDDDGDPTRGGTLVDAEDSAPPILNPLLADGISIAGQRIASNILQNLLTVDADGRYVPQLAEEVPSGGDVREGPLRVTFRLREGARWSDGRPVTSADVEFTWRTMTDPNVQVASPGGWAQIREIRAGRTAAGEPCPEATCFTALFAGDFAPWRDVFSVSGGYYVLPRHVLQGKDFNTVWNAGGMVGSGPFTLESFQPRVRAVLAADRDWWGSGLANGGPFLDRIVVNFLDGPGAAVTALRQGEAQLTSPLYDPELLRRAEAIEGVEVAFVPSVFFEHIVLNTERPPLDDPAVRQALAFAIDREELVATLLDESVPVLQSVLRPFQPGFQATFERYPYDPGRAGELLERAGWTRGADGVYEKGGEDLEIPLVTQSDNELRVNTARLLAAHAAEAGIRLVPRPLPPERVYGPSLGEGDFAAVMFATGGGTDPSLTDLLDSAAIPTEEDGYLGQNVYRWSNPEADRLMRSSDRLIDDDARAQALGRVQELLAEEVPLIPLYQQPNTVAHVEALEGVAVNPTQAEVFWNSGEWSLRGSSGE
jgi:peptide/nickel transport system substrate-binding protein